MTSLLSLCACHAVTWEASAQVHVPAREYHVSAGGADNNDGTAASPLGTISAAARLARPGDVVTVHEGVYREHVDPPRGGESDTKRIVYQAAEGESVVIKGSEIAKGWVRVRGDTWMVTIPESSFGTFNPYDDLVAGDWFDGKGRQHHTGAVYLNGHWLTEAAQRSDVLEAVGNAPLWFAEGTTIWAQFEGVDPNRELVEINMRQSVFYPTTTGRNYITVRGFTMEHAATPWAPPTAEQIGLIGTNWSKGWVIENNTIRYSTCVGVTLGKYGDELDNTSQNSAEGYVKTIERALEQGWSRANIGHHVVRDNHISHCEQAGIVGSLGAAFSTVTGNVIHDIHVRRLFTGAEMAGIKFHAPIDSLIAGNRIYRTCRGIWLDWMTQGTRVRGNLLHDNSEDLFVEVNHGPFLVDDNIFLSDRALLDASQGGAYVHNLICGTISIRTSERSTPFHVPHSTELAGSSKTQCGDNRFYNNIFVGEGRGLAAYDRVGHPCRMVGNLYLGGARPSAADESALVLSGFTPEIELADTGTEGETGPVYLSLVMPADSVTNAMVTTEVLGEARLSGAAYENPDGTALQLDRDYLGTLRNQEDPTAGPFEAVGQGKATLRVW